MIPLLAMSLAAKFLPSLIGKLTGSNKAEEIAENVVNIAKVVTGKEDVSDAAKALEENPQLALEYQQELHTYELGIEQEQTKRLEAVNVTMRAEAVSGSILQRIWRPINGLLFGITLFLDYVGSQIILALVESEWVWSHIPAGVYMLWSGVLGVAVISRGTEKIAKTKAITKANGTTFGNFDAVKEFGKGILGK